MRLLLIVIALSSTAYAVSIVQNGSSRPVVGSQGMVGLPSYTKLQVDSLTPDFTGALISVSNYGGSVNNNVVCIGTATTRGSFSLLNSTGGVNLNGCGTNR